MSKWRLAQVGAAITLVAGVSLSTVWVTQASSENAARAQVSRASARTHAEFRHARQVGLLPSELASLKQGLVRRDTANAPLALPFWRSEVTQFYHRQTAAYRALTAAVLRQEATVTARTRADASTALDRLDRDVRAASGLGLNSSSAGVIARQQRARLSSGAGTPAVFRSISAAAAPADTALEASIKARQAYVASVVAGAGNDVNQIYQRADAEHDTAARQAWLLGLLSAKATSYAPAVDRAAAAVHTQSDVTAAAVREAGLHDLAASVEAAFKKGVPAKVIVVSTTDQSARLFEGGTEIYSTPVTTGGPELPTDHGVFHIYMKISPFTFHSPWPEGSPYYYPPTDVQYWMPFYKAEGLHDASWRGNFGPGSNYQPTDLGTGQTILGTHGCVNLPADAAAYIWNWAPIGTTVVVI